IHYADGKFVSEAETSATDGFGHAQLGGLAAKLGDVVKKAIPGVKVRPIELSLLQRCAEHCASQTDSDESFMAGQTAVKEAVAGVTDKMVGFKCTRDASGYKCEPDLLDLSSVANYEKKVPLEWITPEHNQVTDDLIDYVLPLIQGEPKLPLEHSMPRYARLKKIVAE
ncbi:MAG: 6-phosphofructokinase, partial [Oscillospiraceae bacterium]